MISTWEQLLSSDLPLKGKDIHYEMLYNHYATIVKPADDLLRLDYGLVIVSLIHQVRASPRLPEELMLVVQEGKMVSDSCTTFVDPQRSPPSYRNAESLGLTGNNRDLDVHSVLVSINQLSQIEFTDLPDPIRAWEVELLNG